VQSAQVRQTYTSVERLDHELPAELDANADSIARSLTGASGTTNRARRSRPRGRSTSAWCLGRSERSPTRSRRFSSIGLSLRSRVPAPPPPRPPPRPSASSPNGTPLV